MERYKTLGQTTLAAGIDAVVTAVAVTSAAGLRDALTVGDTYRIKVDSEIMIVTEEATNTLTVTRGAEGTTAATHANGATVTQQVTAGALDQIKQDAKGGGAEVAHTGAGALTIGGALNRVTASAAITMTLADGARIGDICEILIAAASTNLVTIDPAGSTTIDGATTRILHNGETATLRWSGTQWEKVGGRSIPMEAGMHLAANTANSVNAVQTLVALNTMNHDSTGLMVNTAANKITLRRPNPVLVSYKVMISMGANSAILVKSAIKVGATETDAVIQASIANGWSTPGWTKRINGVAAQDLTLEYYQDSGLTTPFIVGGAPNTFLNVVEVPAW